MEQSQSQTSEYSVEEIEKRNQEIIARKTKLTNIKNKIESFDIENQLKLFQQLYKMNIKYSSNNNGVFINLTTVESDIIDEIIKFIKYIDEQSAILNDFEEKKHEYEKKYFSGSHGAEHEVPTSPEQQNSD